MKLSEEGRGVGKGGSERERERKGEREEIESRKGGRGATGLGESVCVRRGGCNGLSPLSPKSTVRFIKSRHGSKGRVLRKDKTKQVPL